MRQVGEKIICQNPDNNPLFNTGVGDGIMLIIVFLYRQTDHNLIDNIVP